MRPSRPTSAAGYVGRYAQLQRGSCVLGEEICGAFKRIVQQPVQHGPKFPEETCLTARYGRPREAVPSLPPRLVFPVHPKSSLCRNTATAWRCTWLGNPAAQHPSAPSTVVLSRLSIRARDLRDARCTSGVRARCTRLTVSEESRRCVWFCAVASLTDRLCSAVAM